MPTEVILPQLGESVAEGVITRWLKQPGDTVALDEPLVEISTDKVNVELPAPVSGVVQELRAQEGETVPVEQVIAVIAEPGAAPAPPAPAVAGEAAQPGPPSGTSTADEIPGRAEALETTETVGAVRPPDSLTAADTRGAELPAGGRTDGMRIHSSPLVRRIAQENGLDLDYLVSTGQVVGTGESGRVTKNDILAYLSHRTGMKEPQAESQVAGRKSQVASGESRVESREGKAGLVSPDVVPPTPPTVTPAPSPKPAPAPVAAPEPSETADEIVVPFAGIRKMIADHLVRSAFTAPHVTTVAQADVTKLVAYRAANKETWEREYGVRLTYTPFFVKATCDALLAFPMVNSSIQGEKIIAKKYVHMGVAVGLGEGGLIVPVIKNAHQKDLLTLARELDDLAKRARGGQLAPADVQGGTFSITNPGVFGAILSTPIINAPQSAILGVEAIQKMPIVREDDSIAIRSMMYLCLSYDHRVVDGETAIKFLQHIRQTLESFRFFR